MSDVAAMLRGDAVAAGERARGGGRSRRTRYRLRRGRRPHGLRRRARPTLASLAARDYFFDNPWKRAWFGNFTNLVPLDRKGSLKESLRAAARTLELGHHLLIFPEGTRSPDGKLHEFKPAIGYLSLTAGADILPIWIDGAHEAMPKGSFAPDPRKRKKLIVRVGPALGVAALRLATHGMSRSAAHREITRLVQKAVEALRDGTPPPKIEPRAIEVKALPHAEQATGDES